MENSEIVFKWRTAKNGNLLIYVFVLCGYRFLTAVPLSVWMMILEFADRLYSYIS